MNNILSISDVRQSLPNLVDKVNKTEEKITITVNGKARAVLISSDLLDLLEETAEVSAIPRIKEDLKRSREQIKSGEFVPLEDLK